MLSCPTKKIPKKRIVLLMAILFFLFLSVIKNPLTVYAKDECKDISNVKKQTECYEKKEEETKKKLSETRSKIENTLSSINQLSSQINVTQAQLNQVQGDINETQEELKIINETLEDRNQKLSEKIDFRNTLLRNYSKKNILGDLELFFAENEDTNLNGFQLSTFVYAFNKATSEETLDMIGSLNSEIRQFEKNRKESEALKKELESAQSNLFSLRNVLAAKKTSEESEYEELEEKEEGYEEELEKLQSKILNLKYGDETGTVGDYASPSAKTPDPSFSSRPAFALFSYGAYTHYNGMSQYGAKGRADDGKSYKDIIKFYYGESVKEKDDFPKEICVEGYGKMSYQKYLYGLAEMPDTWHENALKAQAIAARSYAYRRTGGGGCICTTQACQVFSKSKSDNPPDRWEKAVDNTKNMIIGGDTGKAGYGWYSSTTGGYLNQAGWDLKGKWPGEAYEKRANSPWFYKAWYTKSYSSNDNCGRSSPWLTEKEMADILNAWVVYRKGSSGEKGHITPVTKNCWGGDPYSIDKMAEKAEKYGEKYTEVSGVDVEISNSGYTSKVIFKTNRGTISVDGTTFRTVFNLRAPGYIATRSRLFDIEMKD